MKKDTIPALILAFVSEQPAGFSSREDEGALRAFKSLRKAGAAARRVHGL
jgi:hypothetical protein